MKLWVWVALAGVFGLAAGWISCSRPDDDRN